MTYERDFFRDAAVHNISPVLSSAVQAIDAVFPDELCLRLRPVLPHLAGTADDGRDGDRVRLAQDWLVRTYLAAWMRAAGQQDEAVRLRRLAPVRDIGTALRAAGVAAQASGKVMISAPGRAEGFPLVNAAEQVANRAVKTMTVWNCVAAAGDGIYGMVERAARDAAARVAPDAALESVNAFLQRSAVDLFVHLIQPPTRAWPYEGREPHGVPDIGGEPDFTGETE
ncbi:hypothetical protein [Sphaerimonospora thailandensis]|uniref:Uncharacterized protein n=1 Tax=Sphaerimonospora thailandensis TaxID=795644 RepID=A0A8J3W0J5_9ACTN|nr:hypothetical protein [Sphaerimonospora thailandensis]GIH71240.1 hypothetical protein Mth01_34930 [Sphaerimonospora thailandensis]